MGMVLPSKHWGDIDFGRVIAGVGSEGFEGEHYWYRKILRHPLFGLFRMEYGGDGQPDPDLRCTFVNKIATTKPRLAPETDCMELDDENLLPRHWFDDRIRLRFFKFLTMNAIGLSNMGLEPLLDRGRLQQRIDPFFWAFMPFGDSPEALEQDVADMVGILKPRIGEFNAPFGMFFNGSCPNVGHDLEEIASAMLKYLDICAELGIPIVVKGNALWSDEFILRLEEHPAFSALCMGNTIPWARLREVGIDPRDWFRRPNFMLPRDPESPLAKYGGGGLGGRPLYKIHRKKCRSLREKGFKKPINFCGGIETHYQACDALRSGDVQSVSATSMMMVYPFLARNFVKKTNQSPWGKI